MIFGSSTCVKYFFLRQAPIDYLTDIVRGAVRQPGFNEFNFYDVLLYCLDERV